MTGTSCDGLDAACIEIKQGGSPSAWRPLWSASSRYPSALRARVLRAQTPGIKQGIREWMELDRDLGDWYARSLSRFLKAHRSARSAPDTIACHGQTVAHFPEGGLTLQLGNPSRIATATGLTVICSFREGDLAAQGQGAPLVPVFHRILAQSLGDPSQGLSIHNIGGVSNLTYIGPRNETLAFDTGPGNFWIDAAAALATRGEERMDIGGRLARQGRVDEVALRKVMRDPYFRKNVPKSTGRDQFPFEKLRAMSRAKGVDLVATATAITVESMTVAYRRFIIDQRKPLGSIHVCGGGARNLMLLEGLQARLPEVRVTTIDASGYDSQLIEAQAFAYFGYLALRGQPLGGSWTGARRFGPPAHLIPGENWEKLLTKVRDSRSPN